MDTFFKAVSTQEVKKCYYIKKKLNETYLYATCFSGTFHSRRNIHRISPNIIMRFSSTNYAGCNWSMIDSYKCAKFN